MTLTDTQLDRARGTVLGTATGDALGAGYEFTKPNFTHSRPAMIGGGIGNFAPGEWTDDTSMMFGVLETAAFSKGLQTPTQLTDVAQHFRTWYESRPPDVGIQTGAVLRKAGPNPTGASMRGAAEAVVKSGKRAAGNGSLMRTAPVALPYLDSPHSVAEAAASVSALTHSNHHAQEACVLWSLAIRHAIVHGEFDLRSQLDFLAPEARVFWSARITEAETKPPATFTPNGWVVAAFQAAWSSIAATQYAPDGQSHFQDAMYVAIGIGHDTDTVAAIAGGLLGARWGASELPTAWTSMVHGYPEMTGADLCALAESAVSEVQLPSPLAQ